MNYFKLEESPYNPGHYLIKPNFEKLPLHSTEGSYNVLAARVMNLSYAQYLRMCRDLYGAEIIGKGSNYPVPYFTPNSKLEGLIKELNTRAKMLLE